MNTAPPETDGLLTPRQVSELLQVPIATLTDWRYRGRGPAYLKLSGRLVRYRAEDIDAWQRQHRVIPGGGSAA